MYPFPSRRSSIRFFALTCALAIGWATPARGQSAQELFERGEALRTAGKYAEAIAAFDEALRRDASSSETYRKRALAWRELGNLDRAFADLDRALLADPKNLQVYRSYGLTYQQTLGRHEEAVRWLDRAITIDAGFCEGYITRAVSLKELGRLQQALADLDRCSSLCPRNAYCYANRSNVRRELGDLDGAIEDATEALRIDPTFDAAYNNRAVAHRYAGRFEEALSDVDRALELNDAAPEFHFNRGLVLEALGDLPGARAALERALELRPAYAAARNRLTRALEQTGAPAAPAAAAPGLEPEAVVRRMLEAQVRGDVAGMLDLAATERFEPARVEEARTVLRSVARLMKLSNLRVQVLATTRSEEAALVRFTAGCDIVVAGEHLSQVGGFVALLVRSGGGWKVFSIAPDELLSAEVFDVSPAPAARAHQQDTPAPGYGLARAVWRGGAAPARRAVRQEEPRVVGLVELREVNRQFSETLPLVRLDAGKLYRDEMYSLWGHVPIIGDVISNGYTICERIKTVTEELPADFKAGNVPAVLLDIGLTGWGVVQVVVEPIPGADALADQVEILIEQRRHLAIQRHSFLSLTRKVADHNFAGDPKFLFLRTTRRTASSRSDSQHLAYAQYAAWHGTWPALRTLVFLSDEFHARRQPIIFDVGVELAIRRLESEDLFNSARDLGARIKSIGSVDDQVAFIPVRISNLVREDASSGMHVLTDLQVRGRARLVYRLTCEPGTQILRVRMKDGSLSEPVEVRNLVYEQLTGVRLRLPDGREVEELTMETGQRMDGARLVGLLNPHPEYQVQQPDLTGLSCLRLEHIGSNALGLATAGRWPDATLTLTGLARGRAALHLDWLDHPEDTPGRRLRQAIPVEVKGDDGGPRWELVGSRVDLERFEDHPWANEHSATIDGTTGRTSRLHRPGDGVAAYRYESRHSWDFVPPGVLLPGQRIDVRLSAEYVTTQVAPGPEKPGWETAATTLFLKDSSWKEIDSTVADNAERTRATAETALVVPAPNGDTLEVVIKISGPGHVAYLYHSYTSRGVVSERSIR